MSEKRLICVVCRHADRQAADEALLRGDGVRVVAARLGVGKSSVHAHKSEGHIAKVLVKAADAQAAADAGTLLGRVLEVEGEVRRLATKAEKGGDVRGALVGQRELVRILELLGRLSGELKSRTEVNIVILPQWQDLQRRILAALAPFPAARSAVVAALAGTQGSPITVSVLPPASGGSDA